MTPEEFAKEAARIRIRLQIDRSNVEADKKAIQILSERYPRHVALPGINVNEAPMNRAREALEGLTNKFLEAMNSLDQGAVMALEVLDREYVGEPVEGFEAIEVAPTVHAWNTNRTAAGCLAKGRVTLSLDPMLVTCPACLRTLSKTGPHE